MLSGAFGVNFPLRRYPVTVTMVVASVCAQCIDTDCQRSGDTSGESTDHWYPPSYSWPPTPPAPTQLPRVSGIWKAACRPIHITQGAAPLPPDSPPPLYTFSSMCFSPLHLVQCTLGFSSTTFCTLDFCPLHIIHSAFLHCILYTWVGWCGFQQYLTGQREKAGAAPLLPFQTPALLWNLNFLFKRPSMNFYRVITFANSAQHPV